MDKIIIIIIYMKILLIWLIYTYLDTNSYLIIVNFILLTFIVIIYYKRLFSLPLFFLGSQFIFLYFRIYYSLINNSYKIYETTYFTKENISIEALNKTLNLLNNNILFLSTGFIIYIFFIKNIEEAYILRIQNKTKNIEEVDTLRIQNKIKNIIVLISPVAIYGFYIIFLQIKLRGYEFIYTDDFYVNLNIMRMGSILEVLYIYFLTLKPSKTNFIKVSIVYFLYSMFSLLTGQRSHFLMNCFLIFYFYIKMFPQKKGKELKGILLGILLLNSMEILALIRGGGKLSRLSFNNFLFKQSTVFELFLYSFEYQKNINEVFDKNYIFYIVSNYFNLIKGITYTQMSAVHSYFPNALAYIVNPSYYLTGRGLGTSYIIEVFLEYKNLGLFIYCGILMILICSAEEYFGIRKRKTFFLQIIFIKNLTWLSRSQALTHIPLIIQYTKNILLLIILYLFIELLLGRKIKIGKNLVS